MHHVDPEGEDEEEGGSVIAAAAHLLQASHACHDCGCIVPVFALLIEGRLKCRANHWSGQMTPRPC